GFIADQDRATITKSSTLPHDSAPSVTSHAADEGSMQQTISELTALCTSLQRQHSELLAKFQAQEVEILRLKERVQVLEDRESVAAKQSGDDAPIKGKSINEGEAAVERIRGIDVPTGSGSIPTAGPPAADISTGSKVVPTASPSVTSYSRRKGKEVMVEDAEVVRIHAEEELQGMIECLDRTNETIAKYMQEYQDFALELPLEKRIELISDLVKYQENYSKVKDFKGMTFKEIEAKFATVWKHVEDFIPMGSKKEAERLKRKGVNLEQEHVKKKKTSDEASEIEISTKEIPEEKMKEMMQLVPVEEVYVQALQVKHPIIDWKVHTEGQRSYWKIIRLYEPDPKDQLWTQTQNFMHAPVEWKLYDLCGVHQVTAKDKDIFMLVEKNYPLRKGLAIVMISYKLQVETYSKMVNELVLKIYKIANTPRQQGD
nr:hypothetical protein [Tanacetum cinerariifolium]